MMEQWTLFPTVLQRKFLLTLLAGIASAGISAIICVATKDHILLALGIIVLCACLISCRGVWVTAAHKNYEVVEGMSCWFGPLGVDGTGSLYGLTFDYQTASPTKTQFYLLDDYYRVMNHLTE